MAKRRLEAKEWGFYANTPHKGKIKKGDQVIVYLAGPKDMHFFATATAGDIHQNTRSYTADGDALTDIPIAILSSSHSKQGIFENPIVKIVAAVALVFLLKQ